MSSEGKQREEKKKKIGRKRKTYSTDIGPLVVYSKSIISRNRIVISKKEIEKIVKKNKILYGKNEIPIELPIPPHYNHPLEIYAAQRMDEHKNSEKKNSSEEEDTPPPIEAAEEITTVRAHDETANLRRIKKDLCDIYWGKRDELEELMKELKEAESYIDATNELLIKESAEIEEKLEKKRKEEEEAEEALEEAVEISREEDIRDQLRDNSRREAAVAEALGNLPVPATPPTDEEADTAAALEISRREAGQVIDFTGEDTDYNPQSPEYDPQSPELV